MALRRTAPKLEAATVYLFPAQSIILDELKLKLRCQGIRTTKSELVRTAIQLLGEHKFESIVEKVEKEGTEA
ncbi:MAG: hypothetical protein KDJ97_12265 [Anaerolineae bacterium]|nr:hypothetical protein [Anaerolineae bacterium]